IAAAEKAYRRIIGILNPKGDALQPSGLTLENTMASLSKISAQGQAIFHNMLNALLHDLNVQTAWGIFFEHIADIRAEQKLAHAITHLVQSVLGMPLQPLPEHEIVITPDIQALLNERKQARVE